MLASIPPNQRKARAEGVPNMGAGLIWPVAESDITISDFDIPKHWFRAYAFDTGWNWNAAVWGAWDKTNDIVYINSSYKRDAAEPPINASAIQSRGSWIPGVADAADISRLDGKQYIEIYRALGLDIELPDKAVETGIQQVWTRLSTGKLRIFKSCEEVLEQLRVYSRNEKGNIPDEPRHDLMDALRYLIMSGLRRSKLPPAKKELISTSGGRFLESDNGWMG